MIDDFAKGYLLDDLRWVRRSVVETLDGLTEYEIRRPMTTSGTNLLGLIKHLALSEAVYDDVGDWAAHLAEIERAAQHHR